MIPCSDTSGMLRPEPVARSPSRAKSRTGRWYSRARREAAMPSTPRCQPASASTITALSPGRRPRPSTLARASATTRRSRPCRSALRDERSRAIPAATAGSRDSKSESARCAVSIRPAAFRRGPMRNATSSDVGAAPGASPASASRARRPGARDEDSAARPSAAMTRFSPSSGTRSAIVPEARGAQQRVARERNPGPTGDRLRDLHGDGGGRQLLVRIRAAGLLRVDDDGARGQLRRGPGGGRSR